MKRILCGLALALALVSPALAGSEYLIDPANPGCGALGGAACPLSVAGGDYQTPAIVPTIQNAAYASGNVIGGLQTVAFFRSASPASATLDQVCIGWLGGETVSDTIYIFTANPASSTTTDKSAFSLAAADAKKLVTSPFTLTAAAPTGTTDSFACQSLAVSAVNGDGTATQNLYVVHVVGGSVTPAVGDLFFTISGVRN